MSNAGIIVTPSNNSVFTNSSIGDMLMFTNSNSQKILIGTNSNSTANITLNSNVSYFNSANVGINTSNPAYQLDVVGGIRASQNIISYGNIVGSNISYAPVDYGVNAFPISGCTVGSVPANSNSPFAITPSQTQEGSLLLNGTAGNYLNIAPGGTPTAPTGTLGSFTVEAWVYLNAYPALVGTANYLPYLIGQTGPTTINQVYWTFGIGGTAAMNQVAIWGGSANNASCSGNTIIPLNTWTHIAASYTTSTKSYRLFVNGNIQTLTTYNGTLASGNGTTNATMTGGFAVSGSVPLIVGQTNNIAMNCYVSSLRYIQGAVLYSASFTPSTAPLTPTTTGTTALLLRVPLQPGTVLVKNVGGASQCSTTQAYPPAAMTANLCFLNGAYGVGTYIATASTVLNNAGNVPYSAFDKSSSTIWQSAITYNGSSPYAYTGSVSTTDINGNSYLGEWIQIQLPVSLVMSSYFVSSYLPGQNTPSTFYVLGSRDGVQWTVLNQQVGNSADAGTTFAVNTTSAFNYFRLVTNRINGNGTTVCVSEWILNGTQASLTISDDGEIGVGVTNPIQALEVTGNAMFYGNISAGNLGMFRNRIINGDMRIAQRGTSAVIPLNSTYTYLVDRTTFLNGGTNNVVTQNQLTLTSADQPFQFGFTNALQAITTTAYSGNGVFRQVVEGNNISDFMWGTSYGVPITVSLWIKTNITGTSSIYVRSADSPNTYYYGFQYTILAAGQWQKVTGTIPPPPVGSSWSTLSLVWGGTGIGAATTTVNQWSNATTNQGYFSNGDGVNTYASVGSYFNVTGVQLEKGTIATPFEFRPFAVELQLCQRYFCTSYDVGTAPGTATSIGRIGTYSADTNAMMTVYFPVTMRATPTLTIYAGNTGAAGFYNLGGNFTNYAATTAQVSMKSAILYSNSTGVAGQNWYYFQYAAVAEL